MFKHLYYIYVAECRHNFAPRQNSNIYQKNQWYAYCTWIVVMIFFPVILNLSWLYVALILLYPQRHITGVLFGWLHQCNNYSRPRSAGTTIILIPTVGRNITPICLLRSAHHVAQYCRRFLCKGDSPKAFIFVCIVMSELLLGNHFSHDIQKL